MKSRSESSDKASATESGVALVVLWSLFSELPEGISEPCGISIVLPFLDVLEFGLISLRGIISPKWGCSICTGHEILRVGVFPNEFLNELCWYFTLRRLCFSKHRSKQIPQTLHK